MATALWQPQEEGLREICALLEAHISPNSDQARIWQQLQHYGQFPDFNNYLVFLLARGEGKSFEVRQAAGLLLKNNLRASFVSMPPASQQYIKSELLPCIGAANRAIRSTVGTVVSVLFQIVRVAGWIELCQALHQCLDSNDLDHMEGAMDAIYKICEDVPEELDVDVPGLSERPINVFMPRMLQFFQSPHASLRKLALGCINQYIVVMPSALYMSMDQYLQGLFSLVKDPSADVRKLVCSAWVQLVEVRPSILEPHLKNVTELILQANKDSDEEVALEACEFWSAYCGVGDSVVNLYPPLVNCLIQGDTEVTTLVFNAINLLAEIPKGIDVIFPPDCQGYIQHEKVAAQSSSGLAEHRHRNIFFLLKTSLLAHISDVINDPSIDSHVRSRASSVSRRLNSSSDVFMTTEKCCMEAEYACCMSINKAWASSHLHESNLSEIVGKVEEFTKTDLEFIMWRIVFDPDYTPPNNIHKVNQHKLRDFEDIMSYATPDVAYFLYHQPVQNITRSIGNKSGERWRQISPRSLGTICTITKFKLYKDGKKQNGRMEEFLLQVCNKEETENLVLCRVYVTEQSADTILQPGPQPLPLLSRLHEEVGVETLQKAEEHLQEITVQLTAKISQLEEELKAAREVARKVMQRCDKQNEIIQNLNCRLIEVNHKIAEGDNLRKKQHDRILVLKGNLRVFVRVKPSQKKNNSNGMQIEPIIACTKLKESPDYTIGVNGKVFAFDKVFDQKASQEDVFVEMAELVESVLDGENVSIFTYGQTGSGKTYTMMGELGDQAGIIPRALKQILRAKESKEKAGLRISIKVSILEFYNDESKDLLGESVNIVNSDSDAAYYVQLVKTNRSVATTNMNKESSRSHLVFSLRVSQSNEDTKVESTINLIDLAGSERLSKSGSEGEQKKEAMAINKSLAALSRVLTAIARKESYIPWRDSNLTCYLKPCLEENSKKVMLVNVSSEEEQTSETISSLVFGSLVNRTDVVPAPGGKHKCGKNMFSPPCGKSKSALQKRKAPFLSPAQSRKTYVRN